MHQFSSVEVTVLLKKWADGDEAVLAELMPVLYDELRRMAHRHMARERAEHTLETDALINEGILRIMSGKHIHWQNRAHFLGFFSNMMRHILVDHARSRCRQKRKGAMRKVEMNSSVRIPLDADTRIAKLGDALESLAKVDKRKAKIVEMKFFGGLSVEEMAEALGISVRTVINDWNFSKVWLLREMSPSGSSNES